MRIESWSEDFQPHFYTEQDQPPLLVYQTAVALVGGREIKASLTSYKAGEAPAVWSSWLVLDRAVAYLEIEFDIDFWEQSYEQQKDRTVASTVTKAWIRSLSDVVKYEITGFGSVTGTQPPWWVALGGVELTFSGGEVLTLPGQRGLHGQTTRDISDRFHAALREACGL